MQTKYLADFEETEIYHIYNRTNNKEQLFLTDENRIYFLKRYKSLLSNFVDTYCWNLLPNHFHFLIKTKPDKDIKAYLKCKPGKELTVTENKFLKQESSFSELIEQVFKRFFQSYALAFNKHHNRKGNLFYRPFKRVKINKDAQFTMTLIYIHANAAKHKLVKDFTEYKWSSWHSILSDRPTLLLRNEVIDWFGGMEECVRVHKEMAVNYFNFETALED